jgi:hypothetical protein
MKRDTYTPLLSEVLTRVGEAKNRAAKLEIMQRYDTPALRMILKSSFDPEIKWALPEGDVPFKKNEAEEGTEHTTLAHEIKKVFNFLEGGNDRITTTKREMMFIQMLEGLHINEAGLLINARNKRVHKVYKGLTVKLVKEAFNWDDDFVAV